MSKKTKKQSQLPQKQTKQQKCIYSESIKSSQNKYILTISAKPNSKSTKITQLNQQYIGVSIAAPPREGEANQELIGYIAQILKVKKNGVYVDKGGKSKHKMVVVEGVYLGREEIVQIIKGEI